MVTQFKLDTIYIRFLEIVYKNTWTLSWHSFAQTVILIFVLFCVAVSGSSI